VLAGTYNIALVVDGKIVETKPLRVVGDPDVVLTAVERKKLFDMAMEMHELQRVGTEASFALTPFNARMTEIAKDLASRNDIPADVKAQFDATSKQLTALMPKFAAGGGGRGGGGGAAAAAAPGAAGATAPAGQPGGGRGAPPPPSPIARLNQAKTGLMGGMWPTEQTMKAYADAKTQVPAAIVEANAIFAKAGGLATSLGKYNVKLDVPSPVKITTPAAKTTKPTTATQ
jgi:hypothetical protein